MKLDPTVTETAAYRDAYRYFLRRHGRTWLGRYFADRDARWATRDGRPYVAPGTVVSRVQP